MDQAAPSNQGVLRHDRERSQVADLDRRLGVCPDRHRQEEAQPFRQPLRDATNPQPDHVRTNADGSTTCPGATGAARARLGQSVESLRITLGQYWWPFRTKSDIRGSFATPANGFRTDSDVPESVLPPRTHSESKILSHG